MLRVSPKPAGILSPLSRPLSGTTLERVLVVGFSVVFVLIAIVAVVSLLNGRSIVQHTTDAVNAHVNVLARVRQARTAFFQARLAEKNFLLFATKFGVHEAEARYIALNRAHVAKAVETLGRVESEEHDSVIGKLSGQALDALEQYQVRFKYTIPLHLKLGETRNHLKQLADVLEARLTTQRADGPLRNRLAALVTTIHLLLERAEERTAVAVAREAHSVRTSVTGIYSLRELSDQMTDVIARTNDYVALEARFNEAMVGFLSSADTVNPILIALDEQASAQSDDALAAVTRSARTVPILIALTGFAAIVLTAAIAGFLIVFLRRGLADLLGFARSIQSGDHSVRLEEKAANEFGILARHLNEMSSTIAASQGALTEKANALERANGLLQYRATHDSLTSLPNRTLLHDRFVQMTKRAKRRPINVTLVCLDLDNFKWLNDSYGHDGGDTVLQEVARRLSNVLRTEDTVARIGGDEFALLLEADGQSMSDIVARVTGIFETPVALGAFTPSISASVGIAVFPDHGHTLQELQRNADAALLKAKRSGRNNVQLYTHDLKARTSARLELSQRLGKALKDNQLVLHYQPKVDLRSGTIVGVEALARWPTENAGIISPDIFIPLAEDTGQIVALGEWALREACAQIRRWTDAGIPPVPIAVNLSAGQLQQQALCELTQKALRDSGVAPDLIELEITESAAMQNPDAAIQTLKNLKALGVQLSLDDFGTGYSSLSYLKRLPVTTVKIDRSFVTDLARNPDDASIAQAIITMAHSLGLKVIAEGVETASQLAFLSAHGCDQMQGYYFSAPVPSDQISEMLRTDRRLAPAHAIRDDDGPVLLDDQLALPLMKHLPRSDLNLVLATSNPQQSEDAPTSRRSA